MTSQLNVDTIVDKAGSGGTNVKVGNTSTYVSDGGNVTQNLVQGIAKAWHTIDGEGTIAIVDSFNIASITDNDTGDYSFTYTNNMGTAKHPVTGSVVGASTGNFFSYISSDGVAQATTGNTTKNVHHSGAQQDTDPTHFVIHGDLA